MDWQTGQSAVTKNNTVKDHVRNHIPEGETYIKSDSTVEYKLLWPALTNSWGILFLFPVKKMKGDKKKKQNNKWDWKKNGEMEMEKAENRRQRALICPLLMAHIGICALFCQTHFLLEKKWNYAYTTLCVCMSWKHSTFYCSHVHFCKISSGFINTRPSGCRTMKMSVSFPSAEKAKADTSPPGNQQWISAVVCWNVKCFVALDFSDMPGTESGRNWQKWMRMLRKRTVLSRNRRHTAEISTSHIIWRVQLTWLWYQRLFMLVSIMKEAISEHLTVQ